MLLNEISDLLPPKVLGIQIGKFYVELCHELRKQVLAKDELAFCTFTLNLHTAEFNLHTFFIFKQQPFPAPPAYKLTVNRLLHKHRLGIKPQLDLTKEQGAMWSIDVGLDLRAYSKEDIGKVQAEAVKAFKQNIADVDYVLNT